MSLQVDPTAFAQLYETYVTGVIQPLERRVQGVFREWKEDDYWARNHQVEMGVPLPRPTQRVRVRVRRPESVLDKFQRMPQRFPDGVTSESLPLLHDLLGARVIVHFPSHLRMLDEEIRSGRHFELSTEYLPRSYLPRDTLNRIGLDPKNFTVRGVKPSGYASLHYVVRMSALSPGEAQPWFELQTRTMLEEVWAEMEHQLGYKRGQRTDFNVSRQFQVMAAHLAAIDDHFAYVYDRLSFP